MRRNIPLFRIYWDEEDVERVSEVIRSGMNWATGPNIDAFEKIVAEYVGAKHAVAFNSGTSALHAQMIAHGVGAGDEVVVPSFTFIATANSPKFVGAKPVFADIEGSTYGLDPEDVERRITKRTKAIMPMHYGGSPCLLKELKKVADDHGVVFIEDAAESLGAKVGSRMVGSLGASAMYSLCAPKVVTTGEGGLVVTSDSKVYEKLKLVRSHGRAETANYFSSTEYMDYVDLGYNFRISNITAALGIAQMHKMEKIVRLRRERAGRLTDGLEGIEGVVAPNPPRGHYHIYQMYTVRVPAGRKVRDRLREHLAKDGVSSKVYFEPVHLTTFYRKTLGYKCRLPETERLSGEVLTLPMYPGLSTADVDYISSSVRRFFGGRKR